MIDFELHSSDDASGPLSALGDMGFSAETGLPGGRQFFEVPTFLAASDESQIIVEYNGVRLKKMGTWTDYYGFGTSPQNALSDASPTLEKLRGINAEICVVVTLKRRPCFAAKDMSRRVGHQRIHYIPFNWRHENDLCKETAQEFIVWQNGHRTPEALDFYDEVMRLSGEDAAPQRKGALCTVATPRDQFLIAGAWAVGVPAANMPDIPWSCGDEGA